MTSDIAARIATVTELRIPISEMQTWQPERIKTFFDGIAQAICASHQSCRWKAAFTLGHFRAARDWDDGMEMLRWAFDNGSTVPEMRAYRRAKRGEDLTVDADNF